MNGGPTQGNVQPLFAQASPTRAQTQPQASTITKQLRDLSALVSLGRVREEIDLLGFKVVIRTLTNTENSETFQAVSHLGGLAQLQQLRTEVLARAIETINGQAPSALYTGAEKDLPLLQRAVRVVGEWQRPVVEQFFDAYQTLVKKSEESVKEATELKN